MEDGISMKGKSFHAFLALFLFLAPSLFPTGGISRASEAIPYGSIASPEAPLLGTPVSSGNFLDVTHSTIEQSILDMTIWVDDFFGYKKDVVQQQQTGYLLRWRNSLRVNDDGNVKLGTSARARFTLARISNRLSLDISRENEPSPITQTLPEDPGNPGYDRTVPAPRFTNMELRYDFIRTPELYLFVGAGLRLSSPIEAFARGRIQYSRQLGEKYQLSLAETLFVKNDDLLGETTEITLDRFFGKDTIVRWASTGTSSQEIEGFEWGSELSWIHELSAKKAISITAGAYGNTRSTAVVNNTRLDALFRSNFYRDWLYYEIEPEIAWLRSVSGSYPSDFAVTFRLEIVFQGIRAAAPLAKLPEPPEPVTYGDH